jgi:hypothetical protein
MATENSVITLYRREVLTQATSGGINTPIPPITQIAFGDGGVDGGGDPVPPSGVATALTHEVARYNIDAPPTYPVTTTARYVVTIPANDLIGATINEAALVDQTGALCAIKTMFSKGKDSGVVFTFTFDDEF